MDQGILDLNPAKSVGPFFRLTNKEMDEIIDDVKSSVSTWNKKPTNWEYQEVNSSG